MIKRIVFEYWDESPKSINARIGLVVGEMTADGYSLIKRSTRTIPDGDRIRRHILIFVREE